MEGIRVKGILIFRLFKRPLVIMTTMMMIFLLTASLASIILGDYILAVFNFGLLIYHFKSLDNKWLVFRYGLYKEIGDNFRFKYYFWYLCELPPMTYREYIKLKERVKNEVEYEFVFLENLFFEDHLHIYNNPVTSEFLTDGSEFLIRSKKDLITLRLLMS